MEKILIDYNQCDKVASLLKWLKFRKSFFEREFLILDIEDEVKYRIYIYSAAICHQTYKIIKSFNPFKWRDQLEYVYWNFAKEWSELIDPYFINEISEQNLVDRLQAVFPEADEKEELIERANFIKEISRLVIEKYEGSIKNLILSTEWKLINNWHWFYEILWRLEAFRDPMRKKATFFLKLLKDSGLFEINDEENLIPIMDYHMQRVLMRMWCIEIIDKNLKYNLQSRIKIDSDELIRNTSIEVIKYIAKWSGYKIIQMNDFFYCLWTSCCRDSMLCVDKKCTKSPCTFDFAVELESHEKCCFENVCKWFVNENYRKYRQPVVDTNYY